MENPFLCGKLKTLVSKVLGNVKMHMFAKNGVNILNFGMKIAQTKLNWVESQVNSSLVPFFEEFFSKTLICHVCYFL
jgi:hypothetical protein